MCEQGRTLIWWAVGWCWRFLAQPAFHRRSLPWPWVPWIASCSLVCRGGNGGQMGVGEAAAGDASVVGVMGGRQAVQAGNDGQLLF